MDAKTLRQASAHCRHCQTPMDIIKVKSYSGKWSTWTIGAGVVLCLIGGLLFGLLLLVAGIYMALADETISSCPNCGYYFKVFLPTKPRSE